MSGSTLFLLSAIVSVGFLCQWVAWRLKLPSILFLLLTGVAVGPVLGLLEPDALFGDLLAPFASLAVAIILYEGSLTLKFAEIRGHGATVSNLVSIGVLITWVAAALSAHYFIGWDWYLAALFGAIVTVSGPTVIMPLLRAIRPNKALSSIIRWEGILIDPLGAILAVLVFDFIVLTQQAEDTTQLLTTFALLTAVGIGLGGASGQLLGVALRRHWVPDYLRDYAALAVVLIVFSISETISHESGLLAVTVMGVWQANMRDLNMEDILDFKESLTLILVAGLFIVLAARIELAGLLSLGGGAISVLLLLQFLAGPLRAWISSIGSSLNWKERLFLGFLFPRGIVAAAVSALFALRLEDMNYPGAELLVPMVFTIIVGTVLIQSLSGKRLARVLGVADPEPNGVLVVGANAAALLFARALHEATDRRVVVASMDWSGVRRARMAGLNVYFGSPVSGYAEHHLDLVGIGHLVALSHRPGLNELACVRFSHEFGRENVYTLPNTSEQVHQKHRISGQAVGRILLDGNYSMDDLANIASRDSTIKTTELTDSFSYNDYREKYPERLVLFMITKDGKLRFPVKDGEVAPGTGAKITALVTQPDEST